MLISGIFGTVIVGIYHFSDIIIAMSFLFIA